MQNSNLMSEAAALAGYTIGTTGQDATNKVRAQRRVNIIKADIISRYGGKWDANYREGWIPLTPLYTTGTATFTQGSRTVTGVGTTFIVGMKGRKMLGADGAYYKIASFVSTTSLILTQPYQGDTGSGAPVHIWQDEYVVYPEVLSLAGFVDYGKLGIVEEAWPRNMKTSYPNPQSLQTPAVYTVIGRQKLGVAYATGTISGTVNTNVLTGLGTAWLANIEPGYFLTIGSVIYHVSRINSDTELELHQCLITSPSGATYSAVGRNALIIRFQSPSTQRITSYWYWAKDYPFVNDYDEDWIAEMYPKVIINGMAYYDYLDKKDPTRAAQSQIDYENSIKDMKVATDNAYTGVRTLGYSIPDEARD